MQDCTCKKFFMDEEGGFQTTFFLMHSQIWREKKFNSCYKTWNSFDFIIIKLAFMLTQLKKPKKNPATTNSYF